MYNKLLFGTQCNWNIFDKITQNDMDYDNKPTILGSGIYQWQITNKCDTANL